MNRPTSMTTLRQLINRREPTFGTWQALANTSVTEIMAQAGFDWIAADMEHGVIDIKTLQSILQTAQPLGCPVLARIPSNDPVIIKKVMDIGVDGIIVPMVNSITDVEKAIEGLYYPPIGKRGVGLARAHEYGFGFQKHLECVNRDAVLIVQIEHRLGVENVEEILAHKYVDGFLSGPYDLSASYGIPGQLEHELVVAAERRSLEIARKLNKLAGIHVVHPTRELVAKKIEMGFRFVGVASDFLFLGTGCRSMLQEVHAMAKVSIHA